MIRSVVVPWVFDKSSDVDETSRVFEALGFSRGEGWSDSVSRGEPFTAPMGAVELIRGMPPGDADLIVEVSDVRELENRAKAAGLMIIQALSPTHWNSDLMSIQLPNGKMVAFFSWRKPHVPTDTRSQQ